MAQGPPRSLWDPWGLCSGEGVRARSPHQISSSQLVPKYPAADSPGPTLPYGCSRPDPGLPEASAEPPHSPQQLASHVRA